MNKCRQIFDKTFDMALRSLRNSIRPEQRIPRNSKTMDLWLTNPQATTLTITDCPCTISKPVTTQTSVACVTW